MQQVRPQEQARRNHSNTTRQHCPFRFHDSLCVAQPAGINIASNTPNDDLSIVSLSAGSSSKLARSFLTTHMNFYVPCNHTPHGKRPLEISSLMQQETSTHNTTNEQGKLVPTPKPPRKGARTVSEESQNDSPRSAESSSCTNNLHAQTNLERAKFDRPNLGCKFEIISRRRGRRQETFA